MSYPMSKAGLLNAIKKLHLEPGDVLVCRTTEAMEALARAGRVVDFNVPVVFSPQGIEKLNRQDLLNLLEQLDSANAPVTQDEF